MQNTEEVWRLVDSRKDEYEQLSDRVWGTPELAYTRTPLLRRTYCHAGTGGLSRDA